MPVLSNEALCGQPISGGRFEYGKVVLDRLHEAFPDGKVLIVVRKQRAALLSHYRQDTANGFSGDLARFIGGPALPPGLASDYPLDHFDHHALVGHPQALFGAERVLVLPFEMLKEERERFLAEIHRLVGRRVAVVPGPAPQRVGTKDLGLVFKRTCNRISLGKADWT